MEFAATWEFDEDDEDDEELRIFEGAGSLYDINDNDIHRHDDSANPVPEEYNYDFNDNNPILEENIPVAVNPDNGDINIHDPDMWLHQLDGKEVQFFLNHFKSSTRILIQ